MKMTKAVILLSGGLDSGVLLYHLLQKYRSDEVLAVTFNYQQAHLIEIHHAKQLCSYLGVTHKEVRLSSEMLRGSALTDDSLSVPGYESMMGDPQPVTYVPFRNMIFISIAASLCEQVNGSSVYTSFTKNDEYGYWDTTQQFVDAMNGVLSLNRKRSVVLFAPFREMSKAEIVGLGLELDVRFDMMHSCYKGSNNPNCDCLPCSERRASFHKHGVPDPKFIVRTKKAGE